MAVDGRARRAASADRAGAAHAQQGPPGVRGVAVQLPERRQVAWRAGHRPAGHLPGRRPAGRELRALQVHRRLASRTWTRTRKHSGNSVLRGQLDQLQAPPARRQQGTAQPSSSAAEHHARPVDGAKSGIVPIERRARRYGRATGGSSLPGFMIPTGPDASFSGPQQPPAQRAHLGAHPGAWSRPTAWWWVIVPPPLATMASPAAVLAARHWSSSAPFSWRAMKVKYSDAPAAVQVRDVAHHQRLGCRAPSAPLLGPLRRRRRVVPRLDQGRQSPASPPSRRGPCSSSRR